MTEGRQAFITYRWNQSNPCLHSQGVFLHVTACTGASAAIFLCYTLLVVVRTSPWWEAQYFIPILGMLLGNAISGVSVGLSTVLEEFASGMPSCMTVSSYRWLYL